MQMTLYKSDLWKMGHTFYQEDGNLHIICDITTCNIEEIFIRNILTLFGNDYKIVEVSDFEDENGNFSIEYVTNLPFSLAVEAKN